SRPAGARDRRHRRRLARRSYALDQPSCRNRLAVRDRWCAVSERSGVESADELAQSGVGRLPAKPPAGKVLTGVHHELSAEPERTCCLRHTRDSPTLDQGVAVEEVGEPGRMRPDDEELVAGRPSAERDRDVEPDVAMEPREVEIRIRVPHDCEPPRVEHVAEEMTEE